MRETAKAGPVDEDRGQRRARPKIIALSSLLSEFPRRGSMLRLGYRVRPLKRPDFGQTVASEAAPKPNHLAAKTFRCAAFRSETRSVTSRATATAPSVTPSTATSAKVISTRACAHSCGLFAARASGRATPIEYHHGDFLAQSLTKARTKSDDRRAFLSAWCRQTNTPATLEAISRKEALRFHDALPKLPGAPASPVTLNKYLGRLSVYWQWLRHRELVETDVWERTKIPEPATPHDERERPFTGEEVRKLFAGPASAPMHDLMMIAALTGARLEAIVDLRARDCEAGLFTFKPQKKEKSARGVPIHSALVDLVARRTKGKSGADDLFPEYPVPKRSTSQRERSFRASNEFTEYRRSVGVEEVVPGRRRSLVNFHSFRRYFITKAEQADQMEHIIAVVVGHKRTG